MWLAYKGWICAMWLAYKGWICAMWLAYKGWICVVWLAYCLYSWTNLCFQFVCLFDLGYIHSTYNYNN